MTTPATEPTRSRRRGPRLEAALLSAAWDELVAAGFANLTMESVAARAHTGIAVLYRRWANKSQLVLAAIEHYHRARPVELPDTGALRSDLLALLTAFSQARATFVAVVAATAFSGLMADTGLTPAEVRATFLSRSLESARTIYRRAADRGELDLDRVPAAVLAMPFDLVRHDLFLNLKPLPATRLQAIVDELFLPLVGLGPGAPGTG